MITEGYGKVLSRPGLDLERRELCIVAACAATEQDRQLHSHLHGALNVGVAPDAISSPSTRSPSCSARARDRHVCCSRGCWASSFLARGFDAAARDR